MQINYLLEFSVIVETLSLSEASDQLFLSESSLSRHIKSLEDEIGSKLFERSTRKMTLTPLGEALYPICVQLRAINEHLNQVVTFQKQVTRKVINIGIQTNIVTYFDLYALVGDFMAQNQDITINVRNVSVAGLDFDPSQNKDDIIFAPGLAKETPAQYHQYCISVDSLVTVLPADSPLIKGGKISFADLKHQKLILAPTDTPMFALCVKAFLMEGIQPNISLTMHDGDKIIELVEKRLGVGLLSRHTSILKHPDYPRFHDLYFADINPPVEMCVKMLYPLTPSLQVARFVSYATKAFDSGKYKFELSGSNDTHS
ncbi:MAG: LysR family transcriptional regulator [Clostridiales bacterium]|nr:LysR family transcriptional regulator [Clostridiales bacterium]